METDITNLIKETQELPKKLRIQVKLKYTANSLNKTLLNLFISNNNEASSSINKIHSDFNSSAKLHYAMEKRYSLEELDDEMEI